MKNRSLTIASFDGLQCFWQMLRQGVKPHYVMWFLLLLMQFSFTTVAQINSTLRIIKVHAPDPSCDECGNSTNGADCDYKIEVENTTGFSSGDRVLIVQMKGASIDTNNASATAGNITDIGNAGNYEFFVIGKIEGNFIFPRGRLKRTYDEAGQIQLVRVASYSGDHSIDSDITAAAWDPGTGQGGVVAIFVEGTLTFNADINVQGTGYQGIVNTDNGSDECGLNPDDWMVFPSSHDHVSPKGQGVVVDDANTNGGRAPRGNGGGGGINGDTGGGGGSNYGAGGAGGDRWCNGTQGIAAGGLGGVEMSSYVSENRIFFGGAGGAGFITNNNSSTAADGGGLVVIRAKRIVGNGHTINASGTSPVASNPVGAPDGGGGGGGGGTVAFEIQEFNGTLTIDVSGGNGQDLNTDNHHGPGGGGGGGAFLYNLSALPSGITVNRNGGLAGKHTDNATNGALDGSEGGIVSYFNFVYSEEDSDNDNISDFCDLDTDNDGILDENEDGQTGTDPSKDDDNDNTPNYKDSDLVTADGRPFVDDNGDGINDLFDRDRDGIPDFQDLDSDNDGFTDAYEAGGTSDPSGHYGTFPDVNINGLNDEVDPGAGGTALILLDVDNDGSPNFVDIDSDNDGVSDAYESSSSTIATGIDSDNNGIDDVFDASAGGALNTFVDSDGDAIMDAFDLDADNDGITDYYETSGLASTSLDADLDGIVDAFDVDITNGADLNNDGIDDASNPIDTDADGLFDYRDLDADADGIIDNIEAQATVGYIAPLNNDTDTDGLDNAYDPDNGGTTIIPSNIDGDDLPDFLDINSDEDSESDIIEAHDLNRDGSSDITPLGTDGDNDGLDDAFDSTIGNDPTDGGELATDYPDADDSGDDRDWRQNLPKVTISVDEVIISELLEVATVTITLSETTYQDITIPLTYDASTATEGAGGDYLALPKTNAFTAAEIVIPAGQLFGEITITAVDDLIDEDPETVIIEMGTILGAKIQGDASKTVTIVDNDAAGFTVSAISNSVSESGTTATFSVILNSAPTADVVLDLLLSADHLTEAAIDALDNELTFKVADWNTAQVVTVTGQDDVIIDGDQAFDITVSIKSSSDGNYSGLASQTISGVNLDDDAAPVAIDDVDLLLNKTNEDVAITIDVAANDTDDKDALDITSVDLNLVDVGIQNTITNAFGTWTANNSGEVTYSPLLDFNGVTSIQYTISDTDAFVSNSATIAVQVVPQNDAPVAVVDAITVLEGGTSTTLVSTNISVLDNDTDVENNTLNAILEEDVKNGDLTLNTNGTFSYTHNGSETTSDSFTYKANDGSINSDIVTVSITVTPQNDPPVIIANNVSIAEGTISVQTVSATDPDDGDTKTYSISGDDAALFSIVPGTGVLTFITAPDFESPMDAGTNNIYDLIVQVEDADGLKDSQAITVTVKNVIDALSLQFGAASYQDSEATGSNIPVIVASGEILATSVTVNATITGGTATIIDDYTHTVLVTIPAGDYTLAQSIPLTLSIVNETVAEDNETIMFELDGQTAGVSIGTQATSTYTIVNDDIPSITLGLTGSSIAENNGVATITATSDIFSTSDVVVNLAYSGDATIITDYTSAASIAIPAGQKTASISLTAVQDLLDENNESVVVDISSVTNGIENGTQQVSASITDDDLAPKVSLSIDNESIAEDNGTATVTATIDAQSALPVTINLAYTGTAALSGTDATTAAAINANSATQIVIPAGAVSGSVSITAKQDLIDEADETVIIDVASVVNGTENGTQQVTTSITDDDAAPAVTLSIDKTTIVENNGVAIVEAKLDSESGLPVTVTLNYSGTAALGGTDANTAKGTNANSATEIVIPVGATTGTVTVTAVADNLDEDDETIVVNIASVTNGTEDGTQQVTTTIQDDDDAPLVTLKVDNSTIAENGGVAIVTAEIDAQSGLPVTVTLAYSGSATLNGTDANTEAGTNANSATEIVIPAGLTSGTAKITSVVDNIYEGAEDVIVGISTVNNATEATPQQVSIDITDGQAKPSVRLELAGSPFSENGGTGTVKAILSHPSVETVDVELALTGTAVATDYTHSSLSLSIAPFASEAELTLTGTDDVLTEGDETVIVDINTVTNGTEDGVQQVVATISDDDVAGITVITTGGSNETSEDKITDSFDVKLNTQPASNVELIISGLDASEGSLSTATLTFTTDNWDEVQTVTVTGEDDAIIDGAIDYTLTLAVNNANSDDGYDGLSTTAIVRNLDNDVANITVSETAVTTSENGTTANFSIVLTAQPSTPVVVTLIETDDEGTVPASIEFTSSDWNNPQIITVTPEDDALIDGDQTYNITIAVDANNSDDAFDLVAAKLVEVTNEDNDGAGYTVSKNTLTTNEDGTTDNFTLVLSAKPTNNVVLLLTEADDEGIVIGSVTFTTDNWDQPQTIMITPEDDNTVDGDQTYDIIIAVDAANSDDAFDLLATKKVTVTNEDDDVAGFTVNKTTLTTNEDGTTDEFTVVLSKQPLSNVAIIISEDDDEGTTVSSLTFTSSNWNEPQTVLVTPEDDYLIDGTQAYLVTIEIDAANSDDAFDAVNAQTVNVTNEDNDQAGFTVSSTKLTTSEDGSTDAFNLVLSAEPTSDVVLLLSESDDEGTVLESVTFTPASWNTPQTVTVTPEDDSLVDGDQLYSITISVDENNSDNAFSVVTDQTVEVTNQDNDTAGYSPRIQGTVAETSEDGTSVSYNLKLDAQPALDVVIDITGLDVTEGELNHTQLVFTSSNWDTDQTITITGVDDDEVDGDITYALTLSVDDARSDAAYHGKTASISVINKDNDTANTAPVANADVAQINEGEVLNGTSLLSNDTDAEGDLLIINTTPIVETENGELTINSDGTYTYTPNYRFFGEDSFTYQICDDATPPMCSTALVTITVIENTDRDGDGIDNDREGDDDVDGDGIPNDEDEDSDGDGILDEDEGDVDTDGDDTPDYKDLDSDNDGILDENEGDGDTDGDGQEDYRDEDSDGDGILDEEEGDVDTDGDGQEDYRDLDSDNDGVLDADEPRGDCDNDVTPNRIDEDRCYDELEVLEGFSPNGDGTNDFFVIGWLNQYDKVSFEVFNRWGNVVYRKDKYMNDWNGESNVGFSIGDELPVGTYYYIITIQDNGEKLQGNIYLNR
ncbi:Ig-like domain-containing protein [Carboxylicivirga sp. M1479]|uniref:Ig-like domain-containing protein n=1 Tax=Carboxylicivirga sp. M1479 TaxID=2594476 RepID=UPI001178C164|nr:Ig-like domain-containing protein [Carboxylicivirga sp. M1479]TRX70924.1 tandem-95 repeat protein [Carboxylicivirga sp. M1479]